MVDNDIEVPEFRMDEVPVTKLPPPAVRVRLPDTALTVALLPIFIEPLVLVPLAVITALPVAASTVPELPTLMAPPLAVIVRPVCPVNCVLVPVVIDAVVAVPISFTLSVEALLKLASVSMLRAPVIRETAIAPPELSCELCPRVRDDVEVAPMSATLMAPVAFRTEEVPVVRLPPAAVRERLPPFAVSTALEPIEIEPVELPFVSTRLRDPLLAVIIAEFGTVNEAPTFTAMLPLTVVTPPRVKGPFTVRLKAGVPPGEPLGAAAALEAPKVVA
jgi:hypothetical protein